MNARHNILAKLRHSLAGTQPIADTFNEALVTEPWSYPADQRIARLRKLMEAVHTEIHLCTEQNWPQRLAALVAERQLDNLLIAPTTPHGQLITAHWAQHPGLAPLKAYDRPIEHWKQEMFDDTAASVTSTLGAIAATGSLILWPSREEPRLMSLVPPVHVALLKASQIMTTCTRCSASNSGPAACRPTPCWCPARPRPPTSNKCWPMAPAAPRTWWC